jgi:hypothetical protein
LAGGSSGAGRSRSTSPSTGALGQTSPTRANTPDARARRRTGARHRAPPRSILRRRRACARGRAQRSRRAGTTYRTADAPRPATAPRTAVRRASRPTDRRRGARSTHRPSQRRERRSLVIVLALVALPSFKPTPALRRIHRIRAVCPRLVVARCDAALVPFVPHRVVVIAHLALTICQTR